MTNGVLLALFAYATFSWGDAFIKGIGGGLPVFEIGFFTTAFAGVLILFSRPKEERWRDFWRMKRPWTVQARALSGVSGGLLGIVAFTTIPFAEAYALIFLSPLFATLLSMLVLKERIGPWRWFAIFAGLAGVFLVVRPGFRELHLGHLAAIGIAFVSATTVILLRSLAGQERRTPILGFMILYGLVINGSLALVAGFVMPSLRQLAMLAAAGALAAVGQILLLAATRLAAANQIAPNQYSQIAWAVVVGAAFFGEYPDLLAILGLAVLAAAGLLTWMRERIRLGSVRWNPFFRNRL